MPSIVASGSNPPERRRSSLAKSAAALQGKFSGLKLNKDSSIRPKAGSCKASESEGPSSLDQPASTDSSTARLLLDLPTELALQILLLLDTSSLFALRLTSASFASLISLHEYDLARQYFASFTYRNSTSLFDGQPYTLRALYRAHHAHATATILAGYLADFVETEILRLSSRRTRQSFSPNRNRLISRMTPHLLTLGHFYDNWRHLMIEKYPRDDNNGWQCRRSSNYGNADKQASTEPPCDTENVSIYTANIPISHAKDMMRQSYTYKQLRDAHQMWAFLARVLKRMLRPPTYASTVEKALRGWNGKLERVEYLDALLAIGGLDAACNVLSLKTLSARCAEVERWVQSLQRAECIRWKENWLRMVYGPLNALEESEVMIPFNPPDNFAPDGFVGVWFHPSIEVLSESGASSSWRFKTDRQFLSEMLGRDLLSGTRWQIDFTFDEDDDEDAETTETNQHNETSLDGNATISIVDAD